jgi:hypothetical protein
MSASAPALQFVLATYDINGTWLGLQNWTLQLQTCGGSSREAALWTRWAGWAAINGSWVRVLWPSAGHCMGSNFGHRVPPSHPKRSCYLQQDCHSSVSQPYALATAQRAPPANSGDERCPY